jgi:hypothetical protein
LSDDTKFTGNSPTSGDIIHPRPDHESEQVLLGRELENYGGLIDALEKKAKLVADRERRRHLLNDIRSMKAHLADKERELKEIEGRHARHLLTKE